jgi:hypothetical protein
MCVGTRVFKSQFSLARMHQRNGVPNYIVHPVKLSMLQTRSVYALVITARALASDSCVALLRARPSVR